MVEHRNIRNCEEPEQSKGGIPVAKADTIKALIKAHIHGDNNRFRQVALQLAAREASLGHAKVAQEIRELVDNVQPVLGQRVERIPPELRLSLPKGNVADLLQASYPKDRLRDMVLADNTRKSLERVITEWRNSQLLHSHGLEKRIKLLLVGPPGCGKTMSARVLAGELGLPLFVVKLEGLISRYLGETSVHLRSIFNAMCETPGVYLFDEFDSIGTTRGDQRDVGEVRRVLSTFLILLEGFRGDSLVVAATNYEQVLDTALFRRFDDVVRFPLPEKNEIRELLQLKIKGFRVDSIDWDRISEVAVGMSYAEVTKALTEAVKTVLLSGEKKLTEAVLLSAIKARKSMAPNTV